MKLSKDMRVVPAQKHYNWLMKCADDAAWRGDIAKAKHHEREASYVKQTIDEGEVWHPTF